MGWLEFLKLSVHYRGEAALLSLEDEVRENPTRNAGQADTLSETIPTFHQVAVYLHKGSTVTRMKHGVPMTLPTEVVLVDQSYSVSEADAICVVHPECQDFKKKMDRRTFQALGTRAGSAYLVPL